ncbi:flavodoxin domain-containing protein [Lacisediminihabitans sp.]|uniref:flavodoxin domain-containing protein n=1 Tax=Lacisediminihabitans sp. TaxID=2787631 RepID=UPI00374D6C2D
MSVLVAYASKYGSTEEIAERIAGRLRDLGQNALAVPAEAAGDPAGYDAIIVGSAVYLGSWRKEATEFVRHNRETLSARPVWLFSSGPLGTESTDVNGKDVQAEARPKEIDEFEREISPRGSHVFFGVLDPDKLAGRDRLMRRLPPVREILPEGDFRHWDEVDAWATSIADELARTTPSPSA